jgi:ribosomal protein L30/L7E
VPPAVRRFGNLLVIPDMRKHLRMLRLRQTHMT